MAGTGNPHSRIILTADHLAICRLAAEAPFPPWALEPGAFLSITRTPEELSLVCPQSSVPAGIRCEGGWRALQVDGPLDFALTGILASLTVPLAEAGLSLFALSTFDTDYLLVREAQLSEALGALRKAGHQIS